jgi:hypothetical protein
MRRKMPTARFMIVIAVCAILSNPAARGAAFQNLNFEDTNGVQTGIPHWTIPSGISYLYNGIFAGEGCVALINPSFQFGLSPLDGFQSVVMEYDPIGSFPPTGGAMYQVGDVPATAAEIKMRVTNRAGIVVLLNGVNIPLSGPDAFGFVEGNVSTFAGTTATLTIESPFGTNVHATAEFDDISFVAVPEPGSLALATSGVIALAICRRKMARRNPGMFAGSSAHSAARTTSATTAIQPPQFPAARCSPAPALQPDRHPLSRRRWPAG